MSRTAYPTGEDLINLLVAAGMVVRPLSTADDRFDYDGAISAAIADWERDTGLVPFLKDATDQTVYYDPPGHQGREGVYGMQRGGHRSLYLPSQDGSVFSSITSVTIGYSTASAGTVLTANGDYWLEPRNAAINNRPYEWITFGGRQFGSLSSIVVVGKRGWPVVPDDAWEAVRQRAAVILMPQIQAKRSGGVIAEQHGDDRWQYGDKGMYAKETEGMQALYSKAVGQYRVVVV